MPTVDHTTDASRPHRGAATVADCDAALTVLGPRLRYADIHAPNAAARLRAELDALLDRRLHLTA